MVLAVNIVDQHWVVVAEGVFYPGKTFPNPSYQDDMLILFAKQFGRWLAVGITDSITELIFVVFAAFLVSDLRMTKVQKGIVVFAFGLRLL